MIGECAEDGSSDLCRETMLAFAAAYGAEAGNIALKVLATGGMYVGGGIAPKILKVLAGGGFMQAFLDKGRLSPLMESIPVRVILDESCALLGAAAYAEARAAEITGRSERTATGKINTDWHRWDTDQYMQQLTVRAATTAEGSLSSCDCALNGTPGKPKKATTAILSFALNDDHGRMATCWI